MEIGRYGKSLIRCVFTVVVSLVFLSAVSLLKWYVEYLVCVYIVYTVNIASDPLTSSGKVLMLLVYIMHLV